ncbi:FadR/GntR family transcriptional regulator, partial [Williamsia sp.]|uniref:FadR/GntR family transcriptional regulator n=1 Tax=Williamsia sp. TaxID=1872085 RepID=UPI002F95E696
MPFQPIERRSVPEDVFEQIVEGVLSGDLPAGQSLPSERELARVLGVSRPAVREALKRVAAAGLVSIRQGDGTVVRDVRRFGGLDLLPRLLIRKGELDVSVARSVIEARAHIGPKVAELAALRASGDQITALND